MSLISETKKIIDNVKINELMSKHTSFCIGGPAEIFAEVDNIKQLQEIIKYAHSKNIFLFVLGKGTNLLIKDEGIKGIVLKLNGTFNKIEFIDEEVNTGAASDLPVLASKSFAQGLSGLEFAIGIPGSVGGSIITNAGAYNACIGEIIDELTIIDPSGKMHILKRADIKFEYRNMYLPMNGIIVSVKLKLQKGNKSDIIKKVQLYKEKREKTQGIKFPNAGCIFKNPVSVCTHRGITAGKLIEEIGMKGFRIGNAQISVKHANYIVNLGSATAKDVLSLIEEVRTRIRGKFNIPLELEIKVVPL